MINNRRARRHVNREMKIKKSSNILEWFKSTKENLEMGKQISLMRLQEAENQRIENESSAYQSHLNSEIAKGSTLEQAENSWQENEKVKVRRSRKRVAKG
jgi:hypothetical protein